MLQYFAFSPFIRKDMACKSLQSLVLSIHYSGISFGTNGILSSVSCCDCCRNVSLSLLIQIQT